MTTGQRIQQSRKALGLSQKEFGAQLNVSGSMIGQYENDLRNPKRETLQRIADALDVSVDWLCTGQETAVQPQETMRKNEIYYFLGFLNLPPTETMHFYKLFIALTKTLNLLRDESETNNNPDAIRECGVQCAVLINQISDLCPSSEGFYDLQREYEEWKSHSKEIQSLISAYESLNPKNQKKVREYIDLLTLSEQQKRPPERPEGKSE